MLNVKNKLFPPYSVRRAFVSALLRNLQGAKVLAREAKRHGVMQVAHRCYESWRENKQTESLVFPQTNVPVAYLPSTSKTLRILTYHWHTSYLYELFKLPHQFTMVCGVGLPFNNNWGYETRPMPANARFVHVNKLQLEDYDLAILPFDETVLAPELTNGARPQGWGKCFTWMLRQPLPKIALCHATPPFYGQYDIDYQGLNCMQEMTEERLRIVAAIGDIKVICQTIQSKQEWGFRNAEVIWHGFTPEEFTLRAHNAKGILTLGKMALQVHPYYNGYFIHRDVVDRLPKQLRPQGIYTPKPERRLQSNNCYAIDKFKNYKRLLQQYSIYLNPTLRSPMPFTRTEAMLCGLVPVTTSNQDAAKFIRHGFNGFLGDTAEELAEACIFCLQHPVEAYRIGMEARRTASDVLHSQRFLNDWQTVLQCI